MIRLRPFIPAMALVAALGCGGRAVGTNHAATCDDNGVSHPSGTTWICSDGCNTCGCNNGLVENTLIACSPSGPEGGAVDGEALPSLPAGTCTTTTATYTGNLGGIAGADRLCQLEMPGSHFFVQSRDGQKRLLAGTTFVQGMGEVEAGSCWDCDGWTRGDSGPYHGAAYVCSTGYESVAALVPSPSAKPTWRICEGGDWPLMCCTDSAAGGPDASSADAADVQSETETFACGDALCSSSQICLYPAYGCIQLALTDAGVCPDGTEYSDASGGCLPPVPTPSCVSPSPGDLFDCSGPDAAPDCDNAIAPIPASCSRICRAICV